MEKTDNICCTVVRDGYFLFHWMQLLKLYWLLWLRCLHLFIHNLVVNIRKVLNCCFQSEELGFVFLIMLVFWKRIWYEFDEMNREQSKGNSIVEMIFQFYLIVIQKSFSRSHKWTLIISMLLFWSYFLPYFSEVVEWISSVGNTGVWSNTIDENSFLRILLVLALYILIDSCRHICTWIGLYLCGSSWGETRSVSIEFSFTFYF